MACCRVSSAGVDAEMCYLRRSLWYGRREGGTASPWRISSSSLRHTQAEGYSGLWELQDFNTKCCFLCKYQSVLILYTERFSSLFASFYIILNVTFWTVGWKNRRHQIRCFQHLRGFFSPFSDIYKHAFSLVGWFIHLWMTTMNKQGWNIVISWLIASIIQYQKLECSLTFLSFPWTNGTSPTTELYYCICLTVNSHNHQQGSRTRDIMRVQ